MDTQTPHKRSWLLKALVTIFLGAAGSILATIMWESSLFSAWHTDNPINTLLSWLGTNVPVSRIIVVGLVLWSLASLIYIWLELRRVVIHAASYDSINRRKDVTEPVRKMVEKDGVHTIPVENDLFGGDPDYGQPKTFTIDYSTRGRRRKKTVPEHEHVTLD